MDNKKDWLDEMLSDSDVQDAETIEKISSCCEALSEERKNRILDIISEKEGLEQSHTDFTAEENNKEENVLTVVDQPNRKSNVIRFFTAIAACVCIVTGIKMLGDRNEHFIPSDNDPENTTTFSQTDIITEVSVTTSVSEKAENVTKTVVTVPDKAEDTELPESLTAEITNEMGAENNPAETDVKKNDADKAAENTEEQRPSETEVSETFFTEEAAKTEENDSPEYIDIYSRVLDDLHVKPPYFTITHIVFDMNKDGVNELAVITEKNTNDQKLRFYTIKDHGAKELTVVPVGQNCKFCEDKNTGRLCVEWYTEGVGSVISYSFDGETVSEADSLRDYEYGEDYDKFSEAYAEKFSIADLTYGKNDFLNGYMMFGRETTGYLETLVYYFS